MEKKTIEYYEGMIDALDKVVEYMQIYQSLNLEIPFYQWLTTMCYTERAYATQNQGNILSDMEQSERQ